MKRLLTSFLAAALVAATVGGEAQAQTVRVAPAFELGIYGGGSWTSSWFELNGDGHSPGFAPIFGATAGFFFTPTLGLRVHGGYMPQQLPGRSTFNLTDGWVVNSYLYDLDLVFRPWIASDAWNWMSTAYLFLGGGGYTANIAGQGAYPSCLRYSADVCVSTLPTLSTKGQGVVGAGVDLFPIGGGLGLFGEAAVHGYRSPAWVAGNASKGLTFTPRVVLGLKAGFGNLLPPPPPPVVAPPPPPPPPPPPATDPTREIRVCVVTPAGQLQEVTARYNTTTGDTTANNQPFRTAYPAGAQYAANATWYINNEGITVMDRRYVKYGLPRVLGVNEVTRVGEYMGVPVFAEAGRTGAPEVLYVPVRTGCEFQPYQTEIKTGGVRGE
jgi:hypothetical protein